MNVLLLKKIKKLGDIGSEVNVKSGYARNHLFPNEYALPLTKENQAIVEKKKQELLLIEQQNKDRALDYQKKFDGYSLTFDVYVHEENKLFGSISLQNIIDKLIEDGFEVKKKDVNLPLGPIKELSDNNIATINLHPEVQVTVPIILNPVEASNTEE